MIISGLLVLIPSLFIGVFQYFQASESLNDLGRESIKDKIYIALSTVELFNEEVNKGNLSLEAAQELAKLELLGPLASNGERNITSNYRFGPDGYITILDGEGNVVSHPVLEGQNLIHIEDSNGVRYVQDMIEKATFGGGYSNYIHDGSEKIAYSILFEDWGWVLSGSAFYTDFNKPANQLLSSLFITLFIVSIVGVSLVYIFVYRLTKPILNVRDHIIDVSKGNLNTDKLNLNRNDELGELANGFDIMLESLQTIISNVQSHSEQVAATSEQLSASAQQSSVASEQVAVAIQSIAEDTTNTLNGTNYAKQTVLEISAGIDEITKNVQELSSAAMETDENANKGYEQLDKAKQQMYTIQSSSNKMSEVILSLGNTSTQIGSIISLIEDVADQTNLLALNAAIEAARAGDHGRGFAVVANEVRKLAEQSQKATSQVSELINEIQTKVGETVSAMNEGEKEVGGGIQLVESAGQSFALIKSDIESVGTKIQMINSSIQEINAGSDELVHTIQNAETIAMQTSEHSTTVAATAEEQSASVEEITSASESLASMAEELQEIVSKFKL